MRKLVAFLLLVLFTLTACGPQPPVKHFENDGIVFDYPASWRSMAEVFGAEYLDDNFRGFGMQEIVAITSMKKKGQFGAYFNVATRPLPAGQNLEDTYRQAYQDYFNINRYSREISEDTIAVDGITALRKIYQSPVGEPWWDYVDIWLEKDGVIYLLSFHCLLNTLEHHEQDLQTILNAFHVK
jgi:hypothetical protein